MLQCLFLAPSAAVSGTPGIGKSWWIWYAMWRLQQEATPPAIVWDSRLNLKRRVLFHNGKALVGDRNCFKRELGDRSTWWVVWMGSAFLEALLTEKEKESKNYSLGPGLRKDAVFTAFALVDDTWLRRASAAQCKRLAPGARCISLKCVPAC